MKKGAEPALLFEQLSSIEEQYLAPGDKIDYADLIAIVLNVAPDEYQIGVNGHSMCKRKGTYLFRQLIIGRPCFYLICENNGNCDESAMKCFILTNVVSNMCKKIPDSVFGMAIFWLLFSPSADNFCIPAFPQPLHQDKVVQYHHRCHLLSLSTCF